MAVTLSPDAPDVIVVGSGGGGLSAAITARSAGLRTLLIEKHDVIGGSTAFSGGVMWVPGNFLLDGRDDAEAALAYVNAVAGDDDGPVHLSRRAAYVHQASTMLDSLVRLGFRVGHTPYPDYHSNAPGARRGGRSVEALPFDKRRLGSWATHVRCRSIVPRRMKIKTSEFAPMMLGLRTFKGLRTAMRVSARSGVALLRGSDLALGGEAIVARLLQIALRIGVDIRLETRLVELRTDGTGSVVGITALEATGSTELIPARYAVVLVAGGYAHNQEMRDRYARQPSQSSWTFANPGETGDSLRAALAIGAATERMDSAWFNMASLLPDGTLGMHGPDRVLPHSIIVDGSGSRFVNEAAEHIAMGDAVYDRNRTVPAIPAWLIIDSRHRRRYPFLTAPPRITPREWLESGYMKRADALERLATSCGIDPQGLVTSVRRFNEMADAGRDEDFHRGETLFERYYGDPRVKPNPTLGSIAEPPFYAVALYPGDVGTSGGMLTNEHAQVLREDGRPIPGLYAAGNNTAPLFGGKYPGAGGSIGPSMTFGYIAGRHVSMTTKPALTAVEAGAGPPAPQ